MDYKWILMIEVRQTQAFSGWLRHLRDAKRTQQQDIKKALRLAETL